MTTRRALLRSLATSALIAGTWPATAQQPPKIPRLGVLWFGSKNDLLFSRWTGVFRQRLSELGYIDGKTIVVDIRYAERNTERLNALAREFAAGGVDIIVTPAVAASVAGKQATSTIPIVMLHAGNPVGAGLISSLARPGGNVTGTSNILLGGKQVQLLREVVCASPGLPSSPTQRMPARPRRWRTPPTPPAVTTSNLVVAEVSRVEDFPNAFAVIRNAHPDGLFMMSEPLIGGRTEQVIEFAAGIRLPVISDAGQVTHAGGLMSYGPDFPDHYVMAAEYVDKILRGAKPVDLPAQQPSKFELVINMKTAKALGLTIPQSLLLRANEVIQ